jgi:Leucine-rich repeat (LRR) protein
VAGMKQFLLMIAVVMSQSVLAADKKSLTKEDSAKVIEAAVRKELKKPTGELTEADLKKVTRLELDNNQLTEIPKDLEAHALIAFASRVE